MSFTVILICLGLQRYLKIGSHAHQINWIEPYFNWMTDKITHVTKGHGLVGLAILILPLLVVVSVVFALVYHLLGGVGNYVLNVFVLWYFMDGRDLKKEPYPGVETTDLFVLTYRRLFGVIFWYFITGPVGLVLYVSVDQLRHFLVEHHPQNHPKLSEFTIKTQGVLDWVPVRLLGLSYALVSHFVVVFKLWVKNLLMGLEDAGKLVTTWGLAALQQGTSDDRSVVPNQAEVAVLVDRSLLVWLVVMALITIGVWLG